ncbi:zinc finger BED domain-containing protein 4 [Panulirus ornatus]|uniref:zinc finger BED domain-containing protein 4 n=1 Tax=Panulirus ornatus TaxID=150431 RepID=UPI003A847D1D
MSSHDKVHKIIQKCRSIATHFHYSTIAQEELKRIQDRLQKPKPCLVHDTPTRWNSTLHMLRRTLDIKKSLCLYAATNSKIKRLSTTEWLIMSKCARVLEPFEDITKRLGNSSSTVGDVLPYIVSLKTTLQPNTSGVSEVIDSSESHDESMIGSTQEKKATQVVNIMKQTMRSDIEKRFSRLESEDVYRVATYLDPRYKSKFFSSPHITDQVKLSVARLCEELTQLNTEADEDDEPNRKRRRDDRTQSVNTNNICGTLQEAMTSILASSSDDEAMTPHTGRKSAMEDIEKYHKDKRVTGTTGDSLRWWKDKMRMYPDLTKVACQYLCCPPSSVPCE